jgi:hypothetical protein
VLADHDFLEAAAFVGKPALRIPLVLLAPAQDFRAGPDQRSLTDDGVPNDAVRPNTDMPTHRGLRMGKEASKLDVEIACAATEGHPVIGNPHIVPHDTGNQGESLRKQTEDRLQTAKSARQREREYKNEERSSGQTLQDPP